MSLFQLTASGLTEIPLTTYANLGLRERQDLQRVIRDHVSAVAPDVLVIAEEFSQWDGSQRRIDLLAVDRKANLVVIELKRDETGAHMELQALRYAAMVARMTFEQAVQAYAGLLADVGRDVDAAEALLSFLGWDEPDETAFAQDVRIVLVAADFSRELTSTVMWLNERALDIRCVQVRPHRHGSDVLLDVRQVLPLPEAAQYQVQVREKAARERAVRNGSGRDLTRYDVRVYDRAFSALPKRRAILAVVQGLCAHGVDPDEIAPHLGRSRPFVAFPGTLDAGTFRLRMEAAAREGEPAPRYFLLEQADLIHARGRTVALSKRWKTDTVPALQRLQSAFPQAGIAFAPAGSAGEEDEES